MKTLSCWRPVVSIPADREEDRELTAATKRRLRTEPTQQRAPQTRRAGPAGDADAPSPTAPDASPGPGAPRELTRSVRFGSAVTGPGVRPACCTWHLAKQGQGPASSEPGRRRAQAGLRVLLPARGQPENLPELPSSHRWALLCLRALFQERCLQTAPDLLHRRAGE